MEVINAIGRRKSAVARVYLTEGTGKITINKKDIETYFPSAILRYVVKQPLELLEAAEKYDIKANLDGGVRSVTIHAINHRPEPGTAPCHCPRAREDQC